MANFDVTNPSANQILVYDELSSSFINIDMTMPSGNINGGINIGNTGYNVFKDVGGSNLRFKSIVGGDGITLNDYSTHIEIEFDGDANTLNGKLSSDFILKENHLSDVDNIQARTNLDVYGVDETHNIFMEVNDSNIPDKDNTYDLGSNGRRYADIFAVTFHGTATHSLETQQLSRNNATNDQILVWKDDVNRWIPTDPTPITITGAQDLNRTNLKHRSILRYNANMDRWEPETFEMGSDDGGTVADIENIGNGLQTYRNRTGYVANFRTLRGGSNVSLRYNFNDDEIVFDANVPQTTDDLTEGNDNLYYTETRFDNKFRSSSIRDLNDVQDGNPNITQGLVWNGNQFTFRNVAIDINSTNDIPEGNANLYYTETRVRNVIDDYILSPGITLEQLSDTDTSSSINGEFLFNNGSEWVNKTISTNDLTNINMSGISDMDVMVWSTSQNEFVLQKLPENLEELNETVNSEYFNTISFNTKLSNINSDDINEGSSNLYLSDNNLDNKLSTRSINIFNDVDITGINNNNVLLWDAVNSTFVPTLLSDVVNSGVTSLFDLDEIDINIVDMNDNDVIQWDSSLSKFINSTPYNSLSSLDDVNLTNLSSGETIEFNGTSFVNVQSLPFTLTNTTNDQILVWENNQFVNKDFGELGTINIAFSDLTDVSIDNTSIANGDSIVWDETLGTFVSGPSAQYINIRDINGMDIDDIIGTEGIRWNGNDFEPTILPYFNPTSFNDGDVLVFDTTQGAFISQDKWEHLEIDYTTPTNNSVFVYNDVDGNYKVRELLIDNLNDVNDNNSIKTQDRDHVLRWDDISGEYTIHAPRIIVDEVNDLNDVTLSTLNDNDVLIWDNTQNMFINSEITVLLNNVDSIDVDFNNIVNGEILIWNDTTQNFENGSRFFSTIDLVDVEYVNTDLADNVIMVWNDTSNTFNLIDRFFDSKNLYDVSTNNPSNNDLLVWNDGLSEYTPTNTLFETLVNAGKINFSDIEGSNLYLNNSDNFLYIIREDVDEPNTTTLSLDMAYIHHREITNDITFNVVDKISPTEYGYCGYIIINNPSNFNVSFQHVGGGDIFFENLIDLSGLTIIWFVSHNNEDWYFYDIKGQFSDGDPSINFNGFADNKIATIDNNEVVFKDTLYGVKIDYNTYSVSDVTVLNVNPTDSMYQTLNPTVDSDYIIDDMTLSSGNVYKFTMILDNTTNNVITFNTSGTGTIEYVNSVPPNYDGKHMIEALTLNGTDWIFEVKEIV